MVSEKLKIWNVGSAKGLIVYGNVFSKDNRFFFKKSINNLFLAVLGLRCCARASLVAASGGSSLLRSAGFSLRWLLLLRSTGSRRVGSVVVAHRLSSCGSWALECRLSSCGTQA